MLYPAELRAPDCKVSVRRGAVKKRNAADGPLSLPPAPAGRMSPMYERTDKPAFSLARMLLVAALVAGAGAGAYLAGERVWRYLTAPPPANLPVRAYAVIDFQAPPQWKQGRTVSLRYRGQGLSLPAVFDVTPPAGTSGGRIEYVARPRKTITIAGEPADLVAMPPMDDYEVQWRHWVDLPRMISVSYFCITPTDAPSPPQDAAAVTGLLNGPHVIRVYGR